MFLPIRDDNPHNITPIATWFLIFVCILVFFWQQALDARNYQLAILTYGVIPADLFDRAEIDPLISTIPAWLTIFTSMFLHGGWMHLGGNMLYLWIFGDNVEASMGTFRFLVFYFICGFVAALSQSISQPDSTVPMIGASGAVSGILGAYMILFPKANIKVLFWLFIFITMINVPAWIVLGLWFLGQLINQTSISSGNAGVAFLAHIGGFIAGVLLILKMKRPGVALFKSQSSPPYKVVSKSLRRKRGSVPDSGNRDS